MYMYITHSESYSTATHGGYLLQFGKDSRHGQFGGSKHHPLVAATGLEVISEEEYSVGRATTLMPCGTLSNLSYNSKVSFFDDIIFYLLHTAASGTSYGLN